MPAPRVTAVSSRHRRFLASPALAIGAIVLANVGSAVLAADASVSIVDLAFDPASVTVNVGDSVTWTNNDQVPHTATADGGSFDTGSIGNGQSDSVTFSAAGTFPYHCTIHPQMTGTVIVQGAAPTAAPTPAPPAPTPAPPAPTAAPPGSTPAPPAPGATPGSTTPPTDVGEPRQTAPPIGMAALGAIGVATAVAFGLAARRVRRRAVG